VDLLRTDLLLRYLQKPSEFREEISMLPKHRLVVVDEIQKAPMLLDEIHGLIQDEGRVFALCGSSARKLRRGHANLLGGRAMRYELYGLTSAEIGTQFDLRRMLNAGPLPSHYTHDNPDLALRSYVMDYLREEILDEGLMRKLPTFSDFLRVAAIGDTEVVNLSNIARECGVSAPTVRDHYSIMEDTLLGSFLPAYTARAKRRTQHAPKFYFRDIGVVNHLAKRGSVQAGSELFGKAFENWLHHEITACSRYSQAFYDLSYWRLSTGAEVDFVFGEAVIAIEAEMGEAPRSGDDGACPIDRADVLPGGEAWGVGRAD
jgi:predicted AAA+ superfamily ATPase